MTTNKPSNHLPQELFEQFFRNHTAIMLLINGEDGQIIAANTAAEHFYGYSLSQLQAMKIYDIHKVSPHELDPDLRKAMRNESTYFVFSHYLANGESRTVEIYTTSIVFKQLVCLFCIIHDITMRKHMEHVLKIHHDLNAALSGCINFQEGMRLFLEAALRVSNTDCGGIYIFNDATGGLELVFHQGLSEEFISKVKFFGPDTPNVRLVREKRSIYKKHSEFEFGKDELRLKEKLMALCVIPIQYHGEAIGCLNAASHALTEIPETAQVALETIVGQFGATLARLIVQEKLHESEERFRLLAEKVADVIWVADAKTGQFRYMSTSVKNLTGYSVEEMMAKNIVDLMPPGIQEALKRELALRSTEFKRGIEKTYVDDLKQACKDGTFIWVESTSRLCINEKTGRVEVYGVTRNITEKKRLQEEHEKLEQQRNQRQKLESLGILAGGIAHDFNNLMSGVFGYIDLALSVSRNTAVSQYLNNAISAIDRARGLTRQLLTFSKGGAPTQKTQSCIELIRETVQFALSGSAVACTFDLPQDLWPGVFDREQIAQVIDNMIINAQQAMPQGGTILIIACNLKLSEKEHAILPSGNYLKISICDQGIGMPAEIIPHIFDPFFTTKTSGHGMGLPTCYSIVRRHGGVIEVDSQSGKGSIFHIYLPAVPKIPESEEEGAVIKLKGSGMVLVMDDEEIVRNSTAGMLRTFGFTAIVASDGKEALEIYRQKTGLGGFFAALILDRTIPGGMGGIEMIRELRKTDIATPVFVSSGYADNPCMIRPSDFGFTASIQKPFRRAELAALLYEHLGKEKAMRDAPRK